MHVVVLQLLVQHFLEHVVQADDPDHLPHVRPLLDDQVIDLAISPYSSYIRRNDLAFVVLLLLAADECDRLPLLLENHQHFQHRRVLAHDQRLDWVRQTKDALPVVLVRVLQQCFRVDRPQDPLWVSLIVDRDS